MKLYLIRGLPDSGKTTFAQALLAGGLVDFVFAADDFWDELAALHDVTYQQAFDPNLLGAAHQLCQSRVKTAIDLGARVAVANTFTTQRELAPYFQMARDANYEVCLLTTERHYFFRSTNGHAVPPEALKRMTERWQHMDPRFLC